MLLRRAYCRKLLPFILRAAERNASGHSKRIYDCEVKQQDIEGFLKFPHIIKYMAFFQRKTLTWSEIKEWFKWKEIEEMRKDQKFLPQRHKTLGPDLASAHFFVFRGAKIRFHGSSIWLTEENIKTREIPSVHIPQLYLEGIDASETNLCYEGFDNLVYLGCLKELRLRNCPYIDDFCLHRLHLVEESLELLDISGCVNVTERGLCTLYKLRHLKKLIINDTKSIKHKELTCLLLQDIIPECEIEGVDYDDPGLRRRLKKYL